MKLEKREIPIGKWLITEKGIMWTENNTYIYSTENLVAEDEFIANFVRKTNLSLKDVEELDKVLIYASEYYKFNINEVSFKDTVVLYQQMPKIE